MLDEAGRASKIHAQQIEYRQTFKDVFNDLEHQYSLELDGMLEEYNRIVRQLNESRESVQKIIRTNDNMSQRLAIVRATLTEIQQDVF